MVDTPVSILGADYDALVPMSTGGMGELFRSHKRGLDVDVVVKRVKSQYRGRENETREANILKNLRHQFLPQIYDIIYANDGFIYTVMDYIRGCNLQEYVDKHGALSQKQSLKWLRQLCEVIAYLHQQKPPVIHCDIKPQNIMITPEGNICVIDFNTSLIFENSEMKSLGVTHGYAAPEQYHVSEDVLNCMDGDAQRQWRVWSKASAAYGTVTERTDIYGIGAVAYFMLTGYTPAHSLGDVEPLSRYKIRLTDAFREVIERAMRPSPKERFPSAQAMRNALDPNSLKKADQRFRGWRVRCQITAVTLGALALVSVFSIWMGLEQRRQDQWSSYRQIVAEADSLIEQQQYEQGLNTLSRAIALDDDRIDAYMRIATILYRLGRYSECIDLLSDLSFVYDESTMTQQEFDYAQAEMNYVLGSCYFQEEKYTEAVQSLELAVWFDGQEPLYCRDLAIAQALRGSFDLARQSYETLQRMSGASQEDLLLVEGELAFAESKYEDALPALLQLTQSGDSGLASRSYLLAAQCYQNIGDSAQEIAVLESACSALDVSLSALHMERLIEAYLRSGNADNSQESYGKAFALCESLMNRGTATLSVRLNAALALQYMGRVEEALAVAGQAVEDYPNSYRPYARLTLIYLDQQVRDYDKAKDAYEQAATLYSGAGVQDSEMAYLTSVINDLAFGSG